MVHIKTLKFKIGSIYIFLVAIIAVVGSISAFNIYRLSKSIDGLMTYNYTSISASNNMMHAIDAEDKAILEYSQSEKKPAIDLFYNENEEFYKWFNIEKNNITENGEKQIVQEINSDYIDFAKVFSQSQDYANNHNGSENIAYYNNIVTLKVNRVKDNLNKLTNINEKAMFSGKNKAKVDAQLSLYLILIMSAVAATFGLIVSMIRTNQSLKPIYLLTETIKSVKEGELYKQAPVVNDDEIGMLSREFNSMTKRLHEFEESTTGKLLSEKNKSVAIVKSISDPLIVLDENYKILLLNKSFENLFQLTEENTINRQFLEAIKNVELYEYIFNVISNNVEEEKVINIKGKNDIYYFNIKVTVVKNNEGKIKSIVVLLKNMTEFKKLENIRADFIATVSHELKTPLTSIMMGVGLMFEKKMGSINEKQMSTLNAIKEEVEKLSDLVNNLLKLSTIQSDRALFDIKPCSLVGIAENCTNNYNEQSEDNDITLYDEIDDDLPRVNADAEKITWVLNNLVSNALKYTNAGDQIIIDAKVKDNMMNVYVKDTGVGIPDEYRKKIFEKFVKIKGNDNELISMGLGLYIAKEIVEAHGGIIWCESTVDEGSTFTFTLPIEK